jgi:hypothetical protein
LLVVAGCGGGGEAAARKPALAWDGAPVLRISPTGARVLIGTVRNVSLGKGKFKIGSSELKLVDRRGRPIKASVGFVSTFVRSIYPQNGRPGSRRSEFPEAEQRRLGYIAVLRSGETAPLTVSWQGRRGTRAAAKIEFGGRSLPVPATAEPAGSG